MSFFEERPQGSTPAIYEAAASRWRTYADLYDAIEEWAGRFRSNSKPLILSFSRNDVASVAVYLAALESGSVVALLPDNLATEFQAGLIAAYRPEFVFDSTLSADYGSHYQRDSSKLGLWRIRVPVEAPAINPQLSLLLATSGTTGNPKFVRLSLHNVRVNAHAIAEALKIDSSGRAIASLPLHYSYGLSVLNSHLIQGASVALTNEGLVSADFWRVVREQQCNSFAGVPYSYQMLDRLSLERLDVPALMTLTQAGGKLSSLLIEKFHQSMATRGGRFFTMYGQTEATARIAILPSDLLPRKLGSVGFPIAGGSVEIGSGGEIIYSGPNVMLGYAECREDLALGDTQGGLLHTGDLGRLDEEGCLWVTGRLRREAKVFGLRLNLDDLEEIVREYGPAAIIGAPDSLRIYCEFHESLFARCRDQLGGKLRIHAGAFEFFHVDHLPTTSAGKIDYRALEAKR